MCVSVCVCIYMCLSGACSRRVQGSASWGAGITVSETPGHCCSSHDAEPEFLNGSPQPPKA